MSLRPLNLDFWKNKVKRSKDTVEIVDDGKRICDGYCSTKFFNVHPFLKGFLKVIPHISCVLHWQVLLLTLLSSRLFLRFRA